MLRYFNYKFKLVYPFFVFVKRKQLTRLLFRNKVIFYLVCNEAPFHPYIKLIGKLCSRNISFLICCSKKHFNTK